MSRATALAAAAAAATILAPWVLAQAQAQPAAAPSPASRRVECPDPREVAEADGTLDAYGCLSALDQGAAVDEGIWTCVAIYTPWVDAGTDGAPGRQADCTLEWAFFRPALDEMSFMAINGSAALYEAARAASEAGADDFELEVAAYAGGAESPTRQYACKGCDDSQRDGVVNALTLLVLLEGGMVKELAWDPARCFDRGLDTTCYFPDGACNGEENCVVPFDECIRPDECAAEPGACGPGGESDDSDGDEGDPPRSCDLQVYSGWQGSDRNSVPLTSGVRIQSTTQMSWLNFNGVLDSIRDLFDRI